MRAVPLTTTKWAAAISPRTRSARLLEKLPPFDPQTARSARDNGALVELLRTYPGSTVNAHVARFVVWGKHADHLISRAAVALRVRPRLAARAIRRAERQDPAAWLRPRYRHVPSLRRAHRRPSPTSASHGSRCRSSKAGSACGGRWRSSTLRRAAFTPTGPTASSRGSLTPIARRPAIAAARRRRAVLPRGRERPARVLAEDDGRRGGRRRRGAKSRARLIDHSQSGGPRARVGPRADRDLQLITSGRYAGKRDAADGE